MVQQSQYSDAGQNGGPYLGALRATYRHVMLLKTMLTLIICVIALGLILEAVRLLKIHMLTVGMAGFFGVILLIVFGFCLALFLRYRHETVRVYEQGLVATNREGWVALRWDEIEYIWHKVDLQTPDPDFEIDTNRLAYIAYDNPHATSWSNLDYVTHTEATKGSSILKHSYVVRSYRGVSLNIPQHYLRWSKLCDTIDHEATRYQYSLAQTLLQQGRPVSFGPLLLSRDGIYYGQDLLPWQFFGALSVDERWGLITITVKGYARPWAWLLVARVPNIALLQGLLVVVQQKFMRGPLS